MIVVAHLRAHGGGTQWVGHVSFADDNTAPDQLARAVIDVVGSSMSFIEGDLIRVFHAPDRK